MNLIVACHITGVYDVNRRSVLADDDYLLVKNWVESVTELGLNGLIFHNHFSESTCEKFTSELISFQRISYKPEWSPNVYRYLIYRDYLNQHAKEIENIFLTDINDVVVIQNPFLEPLFMSNPGFIFCGDEPKKLNDEWMVAHSEHLRSQILDYSLYEEKHKNDILLNCGIIGGDIHVMQDFIEKLALIHEHYNVSNVSAYTGDMGAFNYLMRTKYEGRVLSGWPVNTEFKAYQVNRKDCWFRHK